MKLERPAGDLMRTNQPGRQFRDPCEPAGRPSLRAHRNLLHGSAWLVATVAAGAVSGTTFWLVAAHLRPATIVGQAAALFTAVLLVNYATSLGLPVAVARFAADRSPVADILFSWALAATATTSAIGTAAFLAVAPPSLTAPLWRLGHPQGVALFFLIVTGMSFAILVDVRLTALRRWGWVLARAIVVGVARIPLLWLRPDSADALWLLVLVAGLPALSGLVGAVVVHQAEGLQPRLRPVPAQMGSALRYASVNYLSMLASQAPQFLVPFVVLLNVTPATNASFYLAWSVTTIVFLVPQMIGQVLLVEGSRGPRVLTAQIKLGLLLTVAVTGAATLGTRIFSGLVTTVLGSAYQDAGRVILPLVAASMAWAFTSVFLADARIRSDAVATIVITATFSVATLVPATLLTPGHGVAGTARAWLFGNVVAAAVAAAMFVRRRSLPPDLGAIALSSSSAARADGAGGQASS